MLSAYLSLPRKGPLQPPGGSTLLKRCPWGFWENFTVSLNTVVLWYIGPQGDFPKAVRIGCYSPSQGGRGSFLLNTELPAEGEPRAASDGEALAPVPASRGSGFLPWLGPGPLLTLASVCLQNPEICCRKHPRPRGESLVLQFSLSLILCPLPSLQIPQPKLR